MVRKAPAATREDVETLLKQFSAPHERKHAGNWPAVRAKLIEAAKQFDIKLPPYLAGGGEGDA